MVLDEDACSAKIRQSVVRFSDEKERALYRWDFGCGTTCQSKQHHTTSYHAEGVIPHETEKDLPHPV